MGNTSCKSEGAVPNATTARPRVAGTTSSDIAPSPCSIPPAPLSALGLSQSRPGSSRPSTQAKALSEDARSPAAAQSYGTASSFSRTPGAGEPAASGVSTPSVRLQVPSMDLPPPSESHRRSSVERTGLPEGLVKSPSQGQLSNRSSSSSAHLLEAAFRSNTNSRSSFSAEKPAGAQASPCYNKLLAAMQSGARGSFEEHRPGLLAAMQSVNSNGGGRLGGGLETVPELDMPQHLRRFFRRLGVIPADTPVPFSMLARLWSLPNAQTVNEVVEELRSREVLRCAVLDDGSTWVLVSVDHIQVILLMFADAQPGYHRDLLDSYTNKGAVALRNVEDDGYIVQNLAHHLLCAERLTDLRQLLTEPTWIEAKLHAYGVAAIVQDFRRYLGSQEDADVKLLLQAFMLSLGCCMEHPLSSMLRQQMLSRLMAVVQAGGSTWLKEWYETQSSMVAGDEAMSAGTRLVHLMPRSASLEQAGGLLRMTLRGHSGPVHKVVLSPNGRDVVTVSEDGTAQVWDMNVGDCVMQLARDKPLTDVAVAPDGQLAVVACADGNCCVWDMASGQVKYVLKGHTDKVNAVAIDRQGIRCVTASDDGTVRVWSMYDGSCEQTLHGHGGEAGQEALVFDVAISADGCMAATVSDDFTCRVWDLDEECCMHVLEGHSGWVVSVEFIGSSMDLITASHDSTARVWDGNKGACTHVLEGHEGRLNKVTVDAGGQYAVTCSDDLTSRVWNLDTGECISVLKGHGAWISDAAISRVGGQVVTVSGDSTGILWDATTGAMVNQLEGHSDTIRSVLLTYRGRFAVTASDDCTVRVWETTAPNLQKVDKHVGKVKQLRSLPDGRHVVSVGEDGLARVWDAGSGTAVRTMSGHDDAGIIFLATSQDGSTAVTASADRCLCSWDLSTGALLAKLPPQQGSRVKDMAVDAACRTAAVLLYDSSVIVMDMLGGTATPPSSAGSVHSAGSGGGGGGSARPSAEKASAAAAAAQAQAAAAAAEAAKAASAAAKAALAAAKAAGTPYVIPVQQTHHLNKRGDKHLQSGGVSMVSLTASGRALVTGSKAGSAWLWDARAGVPSGVLRGGGDGLSCMCLNPDQSILATAAFDKLVQLHRVGDGAILASLVQPGTPTALSFSPDGTLLGVVLDSNSVAVWDLGGDVSQPLMLPPHKGEITGLAFSPSSHLLATWGQDCTVRVWHCRATAAGEQAAFFMADVAITCCCFVTDAGDAAAAGQGGGGGAACARVLAVGDAGGSVHFLDFPDELQTVGTPAF